MKVTVCFGEVRVVVPCRGGELLVRELIDLSVLRYRKATGKPNDYWVSVHTLKSENDGGILDLDDKLSDVVDDREQIIAEFEEQGGPTPPQGGDGSSGTSEGSASPEIFHGGRKNGPAAYPYGGGPSRGGEEGRHAVIVTENDLNSTDGGGLQVLKVRRGSESNLTGLAVDPALSKLQDPSKSLQGTLPKNKKGSSQLPKALAYAKSQKNRDSSDEDDRGFSRFARDSSRQSISSQNILRWASAAPENEERYTEISSRKEPLGQSRSPGIDDHEGEARVVVLKSEDGPLGIHVVPNYDSLSRESALVIQSIEPKGRIDRDGRFAPNDVIAEINDTSILGVPFAKSQEVFRKGLKSKQIKLKILKNAGNTYFSDSDSPEAETNNSKTNSSPHRHIHQAPPSSDDNKSPPPLPSAESVATPRAVEAAVAASNQAPSNGIVESPSASSLERKKAPAPPVRSPTTALASSTSNSLLSTNTRRLGKKLSIDLLKGPEGLGFSVTTRDNPAGGPAPIYVKNILPKGAAIADRRLRSGDRLLEVNNQDMTGKSQEQAVSILRSTKRGSIVYLTVSRHETSDSNNSLPRQLHLPVTTPTAESPSRKSIGEDVGGAASRAELLTLDIALNETGSAGLGVSVKGKTTSMGGASVDAGIFIKAVIHGGAAYKDGRLQVNDQLVEVNGETLTDKSNGQAMDRLRLAMQSEGPVPGHIMLSVLRKTGPPSPLRHPSGGSTTHSQAGIEAETPPKVFPPSVPTDDSSVLKNPMTNQRNPVVDRLTGAAGGVSKSASFHTPTQPRGLEEGDGVDGGPGTFRPVSTIPGSPLAVSTSMMIEDDSQPGKVILRGRPSSQSRPYSTIGGVGIVEKEEEKVRNSLRSEDGTRAPSPPAWVKEWGSTEDSGDLGTFDREGMGRQSFSEKRKNASNRSKEFVEKSKQMRVEIEQKLPDPSRPNPGEAKPMDGENEVAPTVPPKSSSFESLQTALMGERRVSASGAAEDSDTDEEGEDGERRSGGRVSRGRQCNESFRTAVDKSYDSVEPAIMDTGSTSKPPSKEKKVAEEGSDSGSNVAPSNHSSTQEHSTDSLEKKKKKSKNILNMFRFGKNRKSLEDRTPKASAQEMRKQREMEKSRTLPHPTPSTVSGGVGGDKTLSEQDRILQDYRRLHEARSASQPTTTPQQSQHFQQPQQISNPIPQPPPPNSRPIQPPSHPLHSFNQPQPSHSLQSSNHVPSQRPTQSLPSQRPPQPLPSQQPLQLPLSQAPARYQPPHPSIGVGDNNHIYSVVNKPSWQPKPPPGPYPYSQQHQLPHGDPSLLSSSMPSGSLSTSLSSHSNVQQPPPPLMSLSRSERIEYLRGEHQKKHQERLGRYPGDDKQEALESRLQNKEWASNNQGTIGSGKDSSVPYAPGVGGDNRFNVYGGNPLYSKPYASGGRSGGPKLLPPPPSSSAALPPSAPRSATSTPLNPADRYAPMQYPPRAVPNHTSHHGRQHSLEGFSGPRYPQRDMNMHQPQQQSGQLMQSAPQHPPLYRGASMGGVGMGGNNHSQPPPSRYVPQSLPHHQRGGSYDVTAVLSSGGGYGGDFDDPRNAYTDNSIYAQIRKPKQQAPVMGRDRMGSAQV